MNHYTSLCDDFGVYVYLNTKMQLPAGRETVLHFFDSLQKTFPQMTDFECRENGEYVLEENREQGSYRWVTLESRRICTGYMNPPTLESADVQHELQLAIAKTGSNTGMRFNIALNYGGRAEIVAAMPRVRTLKELRATTGACMTCFGCEGDLDDLVAEHKHLFGTAL